MKRSLLLFIAVFFTFSLINAQEVNHWPPDEAAIFSENLHIVARYNNETGWPQPEGTEPIADNENRLIRVYDETEASWHEFPYPDEIPVAYFSSRWGQNIYLTVSSGEFNDYHWLIWKLDLNTGEFGLFEPCPNTLLRDNIVSHSRWVLASDKQTNEVFLCDYQSHELYEVLPSETIGWSGPYVSPNGEYLLLSGVNAETTDRTTAREYYSYQPSTGELLFLGSIARDLLQPYAWFEPWLNDSQILYVTQGPHYTEYFLIDAAHPDSIQSLMRGFIQERDAPQRLEELVSHSSLSRRYDLTEHIPCTLNIFDFASAQSYNYSLGYSCGGVSSPNAHQYFYVAYDAEPSNPSSLNIIDLRSETSTFVMEGEIEALESVSPDGAYAAVIMDSSGQVERAIRDDNQFFSWSETQFPMLSFVDVSSGEILYELPFRAQFRSRDYLYEDINYADNWGGLIGMAASWLDEHSVLVGQISAETGEPYYVLLEFTETGIEETALRTKLELILADSPYLIISETQADNTILYSLYNWETQEQQTLFTNPYPDDYEYRLWLEDNHQFNLQISHEQGEYGSIWAYYLLDLNLQVASTNLPMAGR